MVSDRGTLHGVKAWAFQLNFQLVFQLIFATTFVAAENCTGSSCSPRHCCQRCHRSNGNLFTSGTLPDSFIPDSFIPGLTLLPAVSLPPCRRRQRELVSSGCCDQPVPHRLTLHQPAAADGGPEPGKRPLLSQPVPSAASG